MSWRSNGPQAQRQSHALLDRVMELAKSLSPHRVSLARLRSEAEALKEFDPAGAYDVLGAVACLRHSPDEARRHHETAIRIDGSEEYVFNYGVSLRRMGFLPDAIKQLTKAFNLNPQSVMTVEELLQTNMGAGRVSEAERWLCELNKRAPKQSAELAMQVQKMRAFLDKHDVDERDVQALVSRCISIMHQHGVWALRLLVWHNEEDEQAVMCFVVPFEADLVALLEAVATSLATDEIPAEVAGRVVPFINREHKNEGDQWPSLRVIS